MSLNQEAHFIHTILADPVSPVTRSVLQGFDPEWMKSGTGRTTISTFRSLLASGEPLTIGSVLERAWIDKAAVDWLNDLSRSGTAPGDIKRLAHSIKSDYANTKTRARIAEIIQDPSFDLRLSGTSLLTEVGKGMSMVNESRLRCVSLRESFEILRRGEPLVSPDRSRHRMVTGIDFCDSVVRSNAGRLGIVAAINSAGKSSFMTQASVMTARSGANVLLVSLEMSNEEVHSRAIANMTGVPSWDIYSAGMNQPITPGMLDTADRIETISPGSGEAWPELEATIRTKHSEKPLSLIIIDYFQLLSPPDMERRNGTRAQEMGEMSKAAKRLAQDLDACVVLISQFNREVSDGVEPKIDMLRDTGQLENDTDFALLMWTILNAECPPDCRMIGCRIAKNRGGRKGDLFHMFFQPAISRYREATTC